MLHRECFFTMKDVKSTAAFVQALNESLESGALMCQLYNGELSKYLMNLTNTFCRDQIQRGTPRVEYMKQAAQCLGRQPGSNVWVLNEDTQFDSEGMKISNVQSEYIWLGGKIGKRNLPNVAPPTDAALVPAEASPGVALRDTLQCRLSTTIILQRSP